MPTSSRGRSSSISEMVEFGTFKSSTQRYIRRSLDVAAGCGHVFDKWARDAIEVAAIRAQSTVYGRLPEIRSLVPDDSSISAAEPLLAGLISISAFDLSQERLPTFGAYRFLYERIVSPAVRPWLPSAFLAAASMPALHPDKRRSLLQSISESAATAPGWSSKAPSFYPEWVDKVSVLA